MARRSRTEIHYYCRECGKEILLVDNVINKGLCTLCKIKNMSKEERDAEYGED